MGLQPLEFADCLTDSPLFRAHLHEHEKELERTSKAIKTLIQHGKQVFEAAKQLSKAQRTFARDLREFNFDSDVQQTEDEVQIAKSLEEFSKYINKIEDHREQTIETSEGEFVRRLEQFRKENLGAAKEEKKNFDKQTAKFCQSQEKYLNMKTRINDSQLREADVQVDMENRSFYQASMKYVLKLSEVHQKKKFEFVEILLSYMLSWMTFYHQGYEDFHEFREFEQDLRIKLQKTRDNYDCYKENAEMLMSKTLASQAGSFLWKKAAVDYHIVDMVGDRSCMKAMDQSNTLKTFTRQGYLYLLEKKALGTSWTKYFCQYKKESKEFYMIFYNQIGGKMSEPEQLVLESCVRRATDSIERRFCFDITVKGKQGTMTFQALSDEDRKLWLEAMDGKEPNYTPTTIKNFKSDDTVLDEVGFNFMRKGIEAVETRGLQEQGLYRMVGVNSKVSNLLKLALDAKKSDKVCYDDPSVWETKTITSAIKNYLRSLPEPLMTFRLHECFIKAAQKVKTLRVLDVHKYVHQLPKKNFEMLDLLIGHLRRIADRCDENKMTVANLGVCFGPSLMRPEQETVAAIMDIKFCNIIVELLINYYEKFFKSQPDEEDRSPVGADSLDPPSFTMSQSANLGNHTERPASSAAAVGRDGAAWGQPSRIYANQAPVHPYRAARQRPAYTPGFEVVGSTSSSTESLNSSSSKAGFSPRTGPSTPSSASSYSGGAGAAASEKNRRPSHEMPSYGNVSALTNRFNLNLGSDSPALLGSVKMRSSNNYTGASMNSSTHSASSLTGSYASLSSSGSKTARRTAITRYPCKAGHKTELSFEANQMIYNVRRTQEEGWLEGEIDGKKGLVPENYIEFIDS